MLEVVVVMMMLKVRIIRMQTNLISTLSAEANNLMSSNLVINIV